MPCDTSTTALHWWQTIDCVVSSLISSAAPQFGQFRVRPESVFSPASLRPVIARSESETERPTDQSGRPGSV